MTRDQAVGRGFFSFRYTNLLVCIDAANCLCRPDLVLRIYTVQSVSPL